MADPVLPETAAQYESFAACVDAGVKDSLKAETAQLQEADPTAPDVTARTRITGADNVTVEVDVDGDGMADRRHQFTTGTSAQYGGDIAVVGTVTETERTQTFLARAGTDAANPDIRDKTLGTASPEVTAAHEAQVAVAKVCLAGKPFTP